MSRSGCLVTALLACLALATTARGEDFVAVRYLDGYPPPSMSFETTQLRVARTPAAVGSDPAKQRDVDRFFAQVGDVLADPALQREWQYAIPDAPSIEITIELAGTKAHWVRAAVSGANAIERTDSHRRQSTAFDAVLRLAVERARARLAP